MLLKGTPWAISGCHSVFLGISYLTGSKHVIKFLFVFFPVNLFYITGSDRQESWRVEGKLFFLPTIAYLKHHLLDYILAAWPVFLIPLLMTWLMLSWMCKIIGELNLGPDKEVKYRHASASVSIENKNIVLWPFLTWSYHYRPTVLIFNLVKAYHILPLPLTR